MNKITSGIEQILNDPGTMKQMIDIASSLNLDIPTSNHMIVPEQVAGVLSETIGKISQSEEKQQALVHALLPYLRPGRQTKLQRAMEVARLSKLADATLRSNRIYSSGEGVPEPV